MRILRYEIEHHAAYPWQLVQGRVCHLRLRTGEALQSAAVLYGDPFWFSGAEKQPVLARSEMQPALRCSGEQYYSVSVPMGTHKLRYHFVLTLEDGDTVYLSELGVTPPLPESVLRPFNVPYVYAGDHPAPPDWAEGFLWYQIFPDRFCDGKENRGRGFYSDAGKFLWRDLAGNHRENPLSPGTWRTGNLSQSHFPERFQPQI